MPHAKVGEAEALDVAQTLAPHIRTAIQLRTYVIAAHGAYYAQFHGGDAPRLYAEIVSERYLKRAKPWSPDQRDRIHQLGYALGTHNYARWYAPDPEQVASAATAALEFFLSIANVNARAIVEYWMPGEKLGFEQGDVTVTIRTAPEAAAPTAAPTKPLLVLPAPRRMPFKESKP